MKSQVSPVIAAIVIVIAVAGLGFWLYSQSGGKTFTKSEASGRGSGRMGEGLDLTKMQQQAPPGSTK